MPLISILKTADRANVNSGQDVIYTIQLVNSGSGAGSNVVLTDDLGPYTSLFLGSGTPFAFTDSSPASGVSLGTPQYSSDKGATWTYLPATGAGGAPLGYDGNVTGWRIPMTGNIRSGGSFTLQYRVKVK
jgi:conserved repeat domain